MFDCMRSGRTIAKLGPDVLCALSADKGGDPNLVRESQRRRYSDITLVDKVVELDTQWRDGAYKYIN